jgi:hypothetical protein
MTPLCTPNHSTRKPRARFNFTRSFLLVIALIIVAHFAGCGGKPFNVKERPFHVRRGPDKPTPTFSAKAEAGSVTIQAEAVTDEDFLFDTFDANLILAGVLPVTVMITNSGQEPLDLRKARFEVRAQQGRSFKSADAKRAFKRLISYYGISTYSKPGYKESQEDFLSYSLDATKPVSPGESRDGMVFFLVPAEVARETGNTLVIRLLDAKQSKSSAPVELKLN